MTFTFEDFFARITVASPHDDSEMTSSHARLIEGSLSAAHRWGKEGIMTGNCWFRRVLRLLSMLLFAATCCNLPASNSTAPASLKSYDGRCDLCGVWTGTSIS